MKQATVLRTQYLFYRREDRNWPISTLNYAFIVSFLLFGFFVFHYKTSPIFAAVILLFELSDWLDKPRCLLCDDSVTVKRKRYTYRKFRTEELYALGRYQEDGAEPILFLCAASADKLKHFANTHPKEQAIVAKHYGYAINAMTEEQLRQVMLTVYLWKKAKKRLMKAKKKDVVLSLRKQSDTLLGCAVFGTVLTVIMAVLSALPL